MRTLPNVGGQPTVSEARLLANRRNAQRSTGPKTPEGKARSRANALKHGLTGEGVVLRPAMAEARAARLAAWTQELRPATAQEAFFLDRAVLASVRMDACAAVETAWEENAAQRAATCWDQDRRHEVEALAAGLAKRPGRVVAELQTCWHGVAWLLARWEALAQSLVDNGPWDDAERTRALDLLGIPLEERRGDPLGLAAGGADVQRAVADREHARLQELHDDLEPLNAGDRDRAATRRDFDLSRQAQTLRRHESACERAFYKALNELRRLQEARRGAGRTLTGSAGSWAIETEHETESESESESELETLPPEPETDREDQPSSESRLETMARLLALLSNGPSTATRSDTPAALPTLPPTVADRPANPPADCPQPLALVGQRERSRDDRRDRNSASGRRGAASVVGEIRTI